MEGVQGTVAAAEVVEPDLVAIPVKLVNVVLNQLLAVHDRALRDFHRNHVPGNPVGIQDIIDGLVNVRDIQVISRNIDRIMGRRLSCCLPALYLLADFSYHKKVDLI